MGVARSHRFFLPPRGWALVACALTLTACASSGAAKSTRLRTGDFRLMTAELAVALSRSSALADRTPDDPPMLIAMDQVENLTADLITPSEGWFLMDRVRSAQDIVALSRERSVRFVIPAARAQGITDIEPGALAGREPTHALRATIRSVTRQAGIDRTDLYDIEYRLIELASAEALWTATFPLKRAAVGKAWD